MSNDMESPDDAEIIAMATLIYVFEPLSRTQQTRVLDWARGRFSAITEGIQIFIDEALEQKARADALSTEVEALKAGVVGHD